MQDKKSSIADDHIEEAICSYWQRTLKTSLAQVANWQVAINKKDVLLSL